jgi:PAS domain S-box-containing protein
MARRLLAAQFAAFSVSKKAFPRRPKKWPAMRPGALEGVTMHIGRNNELTSQAEIVRAHVKKQLLRIAAFNRKPPPDRKRAASNDSAVIGPDTDSWVADPRYPEILEALPVAVYATDAAGRITFFNEAAAALWGRRPVLGQELWCGSWRIYMPDGTPLPHEQCPMAVALREDRPVRNVDAIAERPDGTRIRFMPYPTPLHDAFGALIGAVNILVDITTLRASGSPAQ